MGFGKSLTRSAELTRGVEYSASVDGVPVMSWAVPNGIDPDWSGGHMYKGAMGIPACWRAANLLADLLGLMPWDAYRTQEGEPVIKLPRPPLLEQPSAPDARVDTISSLALDYLWEGNAIAVVVARNYVGTPTAIMPLPARLMSVRRDPETYRIKYRAMLGEIEGQSYPYREWDEADVLHIKGPHEPGSLRGMGILEAHFHGSLTLSNVQNRQALSVARNSGVPTGLLTTESEDVNEEELKLAKDSWIKAQQERTIAALGWGTKFQAVAWDPEKQQLIEARTFSLTEVELIFGLPPGWLGGMNSARQYSNIEQDAVNIFKFTLGGHLARFEQRLSLLYPRGTVVEADPSEILRADTLTRYQGYEYGVKNRFLAPSEIRTIERKPPLTEAQRAEFEGMNDNGSTQESDPSDGGEGRPALRAV